MKKQTSEIISREGLVNNVHRVLNLGLDVHYRQVTVAMQEDGGRIKSAGKMGHPVFLNWVGKKLEEDWEIYSCYEAGASGYWLHRKLVELGVKNLVVVPKAMGRGGKKQSLISAMPSGRRDQGTADVCRRRHRRDSSWAFREFPSSSLT